MQGPYEYVQSFIRNMNTEMFLSEYHINNLYALLLIGRSSPWDGLKYPSPNLDPTTPSISSKSTTS